MTKRDLLKRNKDISQQTAAALAKVFKEVSPVYEEYAKEDNRLFYEKYGFHRTVASILFRYPEMLAWSKGHQHLALEKATAGKVAAIILRAKEELTQEIISLSEVLSISGTPEDFHRALSMGMAGGPETPWKPTRVVTLN